MEYLLKMRLLAEVYAPGEAVEGMHALVYPLVDVPVAGTRNPNGKLTEDAPSDRSRRCRGGSGRDARPCVSAVHVLVAGTRNSYGILTEDAPSGGNALVYPLVQVPVAGTMNQYRILTEDAPSGGSIRRRGGSGRGAYPCLSAGACSCCWN
jgi:hypothetical protein